MILVEAKGNMDSYEDMNYSEESFMDKVSRKIKGFKRDHPVIFWIAVALVALLFILIIVIIIVYRKPKPEKNGNNGKESFKTKDDKDVPDEFAYVNSYILSTLGEDDEAKKLL